MIIVPTEKQLDWRNAPLVLCALVLINVMIFFLYQSGDSQKVIDAMTAYQTNDYFDKEWPIFQKYLEEKQEFELLEEYRELVAEDYLQPVENDMVMRSDFYTYLSKNAANYFSRDFYDEWESERADIHAQVESISFLALGLRAQGLKLPTLLTHQFLHGDIMHLLGNMFFLIVCGFAVEAAIGHWRFLLFYLLCGVAGGFAHAASNWLSTQPLIGASGAISGVMAMYLAVFRFRKIEFFYWFFLFVGYFRAPALLILPFYIGKEFYSYYTDTDSNVAFMAHAGGFVAGAALIAFAWLLNRSLINMEYIETDQSINPQQQKLAEINEAIEKFRFERALSLTEDAIKTEGLNFEFALLRYNLLKITRGKNYQAAMLNLLTLPHLSPGQIKKLDRVWQENPDILQQLSESTALKLGIQLTELANPLPAEQVFQFLLARGIKDPQLPVFAAKLANTFQRLRDIKKRNHYHTLAKQLAEGSQHGLL